METYGLSVCFVSALAFAIALCVLFHTLIQTFHPLLMMDRWGYERHLSNDAFYEQKMGATGEDSAEKPVRPDEETLTQQREGSFQRLLQTNRHEATKLLVKTLIFLVVDALLFASHWLVAQSAHGG